MPTREEIRAADRHAKLAVAGYPKAVSVAFDQKSGRARAPMDTSRRLDVHVTYRYHVTYGLHGRLGRE